MIEQDELLKLKHPIVVEFVPCVLVHDAFGVYIAWSSTKHSIQIAGRDYLSPRNKTEREIRDRIGPPKMPWLRRVCWTLAHELSHAEGVKAEDKADRRGEEILEAARCRSQFLRSNTRRT